MINTQKHLFFNRLFLVFILVLVILISFELKYFLSGFLGAITLYVLFRNFFLYLVEKRKWKTSITVLFVLFLIIICFGVPIWLILEVLIPKINEALRNQHEISEKFKPIIEFIQSNEIIQRFDFKIDNKEIIGIVNKIVSYIPSTLGWLGQMFSNTFVALFILYFMLSSNRKMEKSIKDLLPFSDLSQQYFIKQNLDLIRSNAYGIPILAISQGIIAIFGYWIFGVENPIFWGLMTGVASVLPVVGTMVVWVPLSIYLMAEGNIENGLFLAIYSLVLVGSVDNILRFTLLKKMADIHPLITVFGVILGIQLFGVMGLIFGPLLLSYPAILFKMYLMDQNKELETEIDNSEEIEKKLENEDNPLENLGNHPRIEEITTN